MPTLPELLLALITDQPLSAVEKREVALHILGLVRALRERFEHAWLETARGVVDPTPVYAAMPKRACTYFAGPRRTLDEIQELFTPGKDAITTPLLGYDFTDTPRRRAWITATLTSFRHASALHLQRTGRPAIDEEQQGSMLDALIGRCWADTLRAEHASLGHPAPVAL
jgi:hypothetical protein